MRIALDHKNSMNTQHRLCIVKWRPGTELIWATTTTTKNQHKTHAGSFWDSWKRYPEEDSILITYTWPLCMLLSTEKKSIEFVVFVWNGWIGFLEWWWLDKLRSIPRQHEIIISGCVFVWVFLPYFPILSKLPIVLFGLLFFLHFYGGCSSDESMWTSILAIKIYQDHCIRLSTPYIQTQPFFYCS